MFEKAVAHWKSYSKDIREQRHLERPKYIKAMYHLAKCCFENNRLSQSRSLLEKVLSEDQGRNLMEPVFKHFAMGKTFHALGKYAEALDHLVTAGHAARDNEPTDFVWELAARCPLVMKNPKLAEDVKMGAGLIKRLELKLKSVEFEDEPEIKFWGCNL